MAPLERVQIAAMLVLMLGTATLLAVMLAIHQRSLRVLHPGWVLGGALAFYGITTPAFFLISPSALAEVAPSFVRRYDVEVLLRVMAWHVLTLGSFACAQALIMLAPKRPRAFNLNPRFLSGGHGWVVLCALGALFGAGILLFQRHYASAGGFWGYLAIGSRSEAVSLVTKDETFSRYQLAFHSLFVIMTIAALRQPSPLVRPTVVALSVLVYSVMTLLTGTRLEVVIVGLTMLFVVYAIRPDLLYRHRKLLYTGALVAVVAFSLYGYVRGAVRTYASSGLWAAPKIHASFLFPLESITSYVPAMVIAESGGAFRSPYIARAVPSTLLAALGEEKPPLLATSLARYIGGKEGRAVYTVTLPTDLYVSLGGLGLGVMPAVLYLLLYLLVRAAVQYSAVGIGAASLVFANAFYVVRVEVANWFPRVWQDLAIYLFVAVMLLIIAARRRPLPDLTPPMPV